MFFLLLLYSKAMFLVTVGVGERMEIRGWLSGQRQAVCVERLQWDKAKAEVN